MHAGSSEHSGHLTPRIQEALEELVSYLSDEIPPLFFAGSIRPLCEAPPQIVAAHIVGWANRQFSPSGQLPTADYIFHAAKKIHLVSELKLFSAEAINEFVARLRPGLLEGCPAPDRASLAADLNRLDLEVGVGAVGGVDVVYRRSVPLSERKTRARPEVDEQIVAEPELKRVSRTFGLGLKKLDLLLSNLKLDRRGGGSAESAGAAASPDQLQGQIVTQASTWVRTGEEMERLLEELRKRGVLVSSDRLLGILAQGLPDWALPAFGSSTAEGSPQAAVRAMGHFISMANNQDERHRRYEELVNTAVNEFNGGSLGRAVTLLDLAASMAEKKQVDSLFADSVQRRAQVKLNQKRLQKLAEEREQRLLFRRFIGFFHLMRPPELLAQLDGEPNRNKRKYLLDLLRVHQADARQAAYSELADAHAGSRSFHWHYLRNLVHLLRTIPRDPKVPIENEIDVLVPLTGLENELPVIREALATIGQLLHERAVTTLAARVNEVEEILMSDREHPIRPDQLISLLDSMIKSLAKMSIPSARRYVVVHALKRHARLGNTLERMTWLSDQDLSGEMDIVVRLIGEIRSELPRRVLGLSLKFDKRQQVLDAEVRTLASTKTPEVIELLTEITSKHAVLPVATTAGQILSQMQAASADEQLSQPSLSGDLALFGLPNLLQNLADSQISGLLEVLSPAGGTTARVWMRDGMVLAAEAGKLQKEMAVYQLLETPAPGQFVFGESDEKPDPEATLQEPLSVQSVLFEGVRRYDEFNRAAGVVPDAAILGPTGGKPTPPEGETDGDLVREVWRRASAGYSPIDCEAEIAFDRFRVRRLYEHWLAEGSLAFVEDAGSSQEADR